MDMQYRVTQNTKSAPWLDKKEYPFEDHYFQLPMGRMHYVDEGEGEPIVLIHGNPGWSFEYREVIKEMAKTNRCIAPDHIGFGLSDKPYFWDYLPKSHANNLEQLLDSLHLDSIALVVSDWGGPIGLSYALKHPEKIKKLVIMNTWMWSVENDPYYQKFSSMMGGSFGRFMIKNFNIFGKIVVKHAVGDKKKLKKNVHKHYCQHLKSREDRKGCYVFPKQIIGSSDWLASLWKKRDRIKDIPTTLIWGMKDIAFREQELDFWVDHWTDPKVIRLPEIGHFPQEESPMVVTEELKSGLLNSRYERS